jgi:hypothetical protein
MKSIQYILIITFAFIFVGCSDDILDKKPLDQYSDADFWKDPNLAVTAINQLYKYLTPDDSYHDWESFTNNAINGVGTGTTSSRNYGQKGWTAADANGGMRYWSMDCWVTHEAPWVVSSTWSLCYREIRDCNNAIKNLSAVENRSERLEQLLAEAKFVRAYLYHVLTRYFGGVIIVDIPLGLNDDVNLPRNTYNECVDFMIKDLDDAAAVLPKTWDTEDVGRATSGAAKALKGRIQLYGERWTDAATTYWSIINDSERPYDLFPDYQTMFFQENENNQEVIMDVQFIYPELIYHGNAQCLPASQNGWGAGNPTQDLVDMFKLLDGKAWNDPSSEYYNASDPYVNRDKRFYATVQYDQGVYFGKRLETGSGLDGNGNLIKGVDVEKPNDVTQTGYYLCKAIDTRGELIYDAGASIAIKGTNVIVMRYAEVLLGYAEAKNEADGPDNSVYAAVNEVRQRAGLPGLPLGLSQDEMRSKIREERRVELSFEHLYYFDCLRWREVSRFATPNVVNISYTYALNDDGTVKTDETLRKNVTSREFSYSEYTEKRVFNLDTDFGWFFPVPQDELDKNPNIVQNGAFTGNTKQ